MLIYSWNVNGLRAAANKGFRQWLDNCEGDIVGLQEVRCRSEQLPEEIRQPSGWKTSFVCAERKGYSGVALYSRRTPDEVHNQLGPTEFDREGRMIAARFGKLWVVNVYFPNGKGKERDNSRVPYKLSFYRTLFDWLESGKRKGVPMLVMGDYNTAHKEIDLARPKANRKISGFLPIECAEMTRWIEAGWLDTFRHFEAGPNHYSWWSQRAGARQRNVGWRIDYVLASPAAIPALRAASIHTEVFGSDHCPVSVEIDETAL